MESEAAFFSQFVEGGMESFKFYLDAKRQQGCWGDDPEIQAICELYNRPAEIWAYDSALGARKLRTFHEPAGTISRRHPMRLSFYGGGHYDSVADPHGLPDGPLLQSTPGQYEESCIRRMRYMKAQSSSGLRDAVAMSDSEETERLQIEAALRVSRNDIQNFEDDLQRSLAESLVEFSGRSIGISSPTELDSIQEDIVRSVAEESEREYIERAIVGTLPSNNSSGDQSSAVSASTAMYRTPSSGDNEVQRALELSALSEQEAFELALQMSMGSSSQMLRTGNDHSADRIGSVDPFFDDDADLQAALTESLMHNFRK
jgi:OTU domain-containing protein 5